ncbi:hypothetical protein COHA_004592 [Chlorella ohadii]|uniref:LysM domain-containing protein n=1 Tax=Chlorella ohadii TaxID=2649997 RepID=A0AAD5DSZ5_9CHLO|nr:hypothetical protein COHA_004592 [Chlorella ohadii]
MGATRVRNAVALCALAVLVLQLGAASGVSKEYVAKHDKHHGDICQFKADKEYTTADFAHAFSIQWKLVLELNKDWCKDRHISHVPKGSLWYLPCSAHHAHIAKWHWKAEEKRSWKGDACSYKLDKDEHPRWVAYLFELDWDVYLQLNPWVDSRYICEKEEVLWIPCHLKHQEKKENWHQRKEHIPCDFSKPEPKHDTCYDHCPGHWPKWWKKPRCEKPNWHYDDKPSWMHPDEEDDHKVDEKPRCCKWNPHCDHRCGADDSAGAPTGAPKDDKPRCCKWNPHCDKRCGAADDGAAAPAPSNGNEQPANPPTPADGGDDNTGGDGAEQPADPPTPTDGGLPQSGSAVRCISPGVHATTCIM